MHGQVIGIERAKGRGMKTTSSQIQTALNAGIYWLESATILAPDHIKPALKQNCEVTEAGHSFDDMIRWGREAGTIDAVVCDNCASFEELPPKVCEFLVKNSAGMLASIDRVKGGV